MDFPKIVIIGAGNLSTKRIYPYIGAAGAKLAGVCDRDLAKAEKNAALWGGRPYADLEVMLEAEKPDGVIICVGPEAHAEIAAFVLKKGFPVYTEKPPAPTARDALKVARVAREKDLLCVTAFKKRYNHAYTRAREFISHFPKDDLYSLSIDYASAQYANDSPRRSFLLDFAIHMIDLSGYLFGEAEEVFTFSKGPDAYAVSVKYANGAVGSFNFNDGRSFQIPTEEVEISIRGGNFMSIHNSSVWKIVKEGKPVEWREPPTFTSAGDDGYDTGHLAELVDFVRGVSLNSTNSRSSIFESYKTMVLYEGIVQSAKTGKPVRIEYEEA